MNECVFKYLMKRIMSRTRLCISNYGTYSESVVVLVSNVSKRRRSIGRVRFKWRFGEDRRHSAVYFLDFSIKKKILFKFLIRSIV